MNYPEASSRVSEFRMQKFRMQETKVIPNSCILKD